MRVDGRQRNWASDVDQPLNSYQAEIEFHLITDVHHHDPHGSLPLKAQKLRRNRSAIIIHKLIKLRAGTQVFLDSHGPKNAAAKSYSGNYLWKSAARRHDSHSRALQDKENRRISDALLATRHCAFDPDEDTHIADTGADENEAGEDAYFHWEEEKTLFSDLMNEESATTKLICRPVTIDSTDRKKKTSDSQLLLTPCN